MHFANDFLVDASEKPIREKFSLFINSLRGWRKTGSKIADL
jgi:hypothetical protein